MFKKILMATGLIAIIWFIQANDPGFFQSVFDTLKNLIVSIFGGN